MKRLLRGVLMFIVIIGFGTPGLFIPAAPHLAPTATEGGSKRIVASADYEGREKVKVLPRSITFPSVLRQGEQMIRVEFPNAAILCLDAAYYAGRAQGLIWAMDRDTVVDHGLQWTIDDAVNLFDTCLLIFLEQAFADKNANDKNQLEDIKKVLSGQIQLIQEKLSYARDVKIKADEGPGYVPFTRVPNKRLEANVFAAGQP